MWHWNLKSLLLLCIIPANIFAQAEMPPLLTIGDPAPPLRVREWIKGTPVQQFEKDSIYVVEFWATWCGPCKAAMPHLSALAGKYRDRVTILGIDVKEQPSTSLENIKSFVDGMGFGMDYTVGIEDSPHIETDWFVASGEQSIPKTFVVNGHGRLAWIGHPKDLDSVLYKITSNTWDMHEALANRNLNKRLAVLDDSLNYELMNYIGNPHNPGDLGKPDSALILIEEIVRKEPRLKYAPLIASNTFAALLKTDQNKAYSYGKEVIVRSTYDKPAYEIIIRDIEVNWYKLKLLPKIYQLGAEAYQERITHIEYHELKIIQRLYHKMAKMYSLAGDKSNAIAAEQKALEELNHKKDYSKKEMAEYEAQLRQYKSM